MRKNRTQSEIDYEQISFALEVVELRKDKHDNCAYHDCHDCIGE